MWRGAPQQFWYGLSLPSFTPASLISCLSPDFNGFFSAFIGQQACLGAQQVQCTTRGIRLRGDPSPLGLSLVVMLPETKQPTSVAWLFVGSENPAVSSLFSEHRLKTFGQVEKLFIDGAGLGNCIRQGNVGDL